MNTFIAVESQVQEIYDIDRIVITLCYTSFLFIQVLLSPLASWLVDYKGPQKSVILGCALVVAGVWLRIAIKSSFYYVLAGQIIAAAGNSFIVFSIATTSERWFSPQERTTSSSWALFGGSCGSLLSIAASAIAIEDSDDNNKVRSTEDDVFQYLVVHSAIATALKVVTAVLYRDAPQKAPMKGTELRYKQE